MLELRKSPRLNVNWRAGIKLPDGRFIFCHVMNISSEGLLFHSPENLIVLRGYPMMIEIPGIDGAEQMYKVSCKGIVKHTILSSDYYRIGVLLTDISSLHQELVNAWLSKVSK
ncbi:PilZ domain-containing protein [Undibacterium sp. SXout7W]|uniref:PilZ domain-containing protein n=1 Tax=Undibacterium sp. SXout7W TaxID=3413049 RepID=UPI003BF214C2